MSAAPARRGVGLRRCKLTLLKGSLAFVRCLQAGAFGLLYSISVIMLRSSLLSGLFLLLSGLLTTAALVAVYHRLRETDAAFALWAFLLTAVGALGSAVHDGYDLANTLNPPAGGPGDLPSQIDPRGLLTFAVAGPGLFVVAWLIVRGGTFPRRLGYPGYLLAILLLTVRLGRQILLDPTNPLLLVPALLAGFMLHPIWFLWLGLLLWRR